MNLLEQHDSLYRLAYRKYMNREFEFARQLAIEAISRAQEFYISLNIIIPAGKFSCRAMNLLQMIDQDGDCRPEHRVAEVSKSQNRNTRQKI